jgi:general stress protein YciG
MKRKNPAAVSLGRKGGKARKRKLTPERLSEIGRKGAEKRWGKWQD